MNINYENEIDLELKDIIRNRFNVSEPIYYIFLRYMVLNKINKIKKINVKYFGLFLLKECNLPNEIIFKGIPIKFFNSEEASLLNIIKNWILDLYKESEDISKAKYLESLYLELTKESLKKSLRYKRTSYYKETLILNYLTLLNEKFNVDIDIIYKSDKFSYPKDFRIVKNDEMILEEKISILKMSDNNIIFSEKDIEKYLKNHLDKIEDGLEFLDSQFSITDAIIDILAKDKNGKTVIIELKIECDERLIWQSIYYPKQYKKEYKDEEIRMICLSPFYASWILSAFEELKNIELYEYKLIFDNDNILDIVVNKVNLED